jgi:hypothetical protein
MKYEKIVKKYCPPSVKINYVGGPEGYGYTCGNNFIIASKPKSLVGLSTILHELGHCVYNHSNNGLVCYERKFMTRVKGSPITKGIQQQELEAWTFAIDILRKENIVIPSEVSKDIASALASYNFYIQDYNL